MLIVDFDNMSGILQERALDIWRYFISSSSLRCLSTDVKKKNPLTAFFFEVFYEVSPNVQSPLL